MEIIEAGSIQLDNPQPQIVDAGSIELDKPQVMLPVQKEEPEVYDFDKSINDVTPPEKINQVKKDIHSSLYTSFVEPWEKLGHTAASSFNRGMAVFSTHLDMLSNYVEEKTGFKKGGIFESAAKTYNDNADYWQKRANESGHAFLPELFGEAIGGAVPGIAEFMLNVPYAGALGAADEEKQKNTGRGEIANALVEAAKRGVLGMVFHQLNGFKKYLQAPTMGGLFATQTAFEGGDTKEIAKGFGTGVLYSLASPGGKMGLNEIRRNLEKDIVKQRAEEPAELPNPSRSPEGGEQTAAFAPEANFRRQPEKAQKTDEITRRSDLVRFLNEKLDIPIRTGRFKDKALGIFKVKSEVIRTENANDIEVISHEIGHAIQKFLYPETVGVHGLKSQPFSLFKNELDPMATKPKAGQEATPEGFAEFIRLYVTHPEKAQEQAPNFYKHFEKELDNKSPETREILLQARKQYDRWLKQPELQRVLSQVSVGAKEKREYSFDKVYTAAVDDLFPLKDVVDEMAQGKNLKTSEDPYKLARLLRGYTGKADAFIDHSPFKFKTYEDVGKSLRSILEPLRDNLDEFRAYIVSRRTLDLAKRDIETGILKDDARKIVKDFDQKYRQAFDDLKEYQDLTLQYLRDAEVLDKKTYDKIKDLNDDYVPLYRIMEETPKGGVGKGMIARNPVKKIKGSWRDIQDPLESIIKNTYLYINAAEKNSVGRALIELAEKTEGMGKYVEKIPKPMQAIKITVEELEKLGVSEIPDEAAAIFRPSSFTPKDNVISVWRNGKAEMFQVHPDVYKTFLALDKESSNILMRLLAKPASWLRAGATLTPEFIGRNPIRDQFSAFVYSKYGFIPGYDLVKGIFSMAKKDQMYWDWKKGGGDHSMLVSVDRDYLQDKLDQTLSKYPVLNRIKNPIELLRIASEVGEEGTRIGEFKKGIKKEGQGKEGMQAAAFAAREVTLDFSKVGTIGKSVNIITAFWNAQVQGMDKMARAFKDDPVVTTLKTAAAITLPSVLLAIATHDDERVKELPQWERDLFWIIPTENHLWRVPKPFELGIIFGSVPERITHFILDNDPHAFDEILTSVWSGASPGIVPTAAIPLFETWANKSMFFDRPIVPRSRTELLPEYQYGPHTTETAKELGKLIGRLPWQIDAFGPAYIDNLVRGWTGGLGTYAMQISDIGLETAGITEKQIEPAKTLSDIPFVKAFHVRYPSANSESIKRFYDSYTEQSQAKKTINYLLKKEGDFETAGELSDEGYNYGLDGYYHALRNIGTTIDNIYRNESMTGDEKREFIDTLYMQMIEIAQQGNRQVDMIKQFQKDMRIKQ